MSPASKWRSAASSRRCLRGLSSPDGVSSNACSTSLVAAVAAPRARAWRAASSRAAATSALGATAPRARWRARSSVSTARTASRPCSARLAPPIVRAAIADASSGCVKRTRSPSSSSTRARTASSIPPALWPRTSPTSRGVGSEEAATTRQTSCASAVSVSSRSSTSSSRVSGDGQLRSRLDPAAAALVAHQPAPARRRGSRRTSPRCATAPAARRQRRHPARSSSWSAPTLSRAQVPPSLDESLSPAPSQEGVLPRAVSKTTTGHPLQTRHRVLEQGERWLVQPLHVVHRDDEWSIGREPAQRVQEAERDQALLDPVLGLRERQGGSSACRCGAGNSGRTFDTVAPSRSASPENEKRVSASDGRHEHTRKPRAAASSTAADQSAVLPIPASPATTATAPGNRSGPSRSARSSPAPLPCRPGFERCLSRMAAGPQP